MAADRVAADRVAVARCRRLAPSGVV